MMRLLVAATILSMSASLNAMAGDMDEKFFENKIRPLLSGQCLGCHGSEKQESALRLDTREALVKGGDWGTGIDEANLNASLLLKAVRYEDDAPKMPPAGKLSNEQIADLEKWVKAGAQWPKTQNGKIIPVDLTSTEGIAYARETHWAFQPVTMPALPKASNPKLIQNEVDYFISSKLAEKKMSMSAKADPRTRLRRVYYDLIGLPPTYEEVQAFKRDPSQQAWEKVIDDLLSRPQYGERWGRYWLDIARYADTMGYNFDQDNSFPYAYAYRDYVIRSFNDDKPYNQFIKEQIAADQIELKDPRDMAAMGFLTLGRKNTNEEMMDDKIDVVSRGFLGLTLQCARCHDHKYDPLSAKDYYALYGVFSSSFQPEEAELPIVEHDDRLGPWKEFYEQLKGMEKREKELDEQVRKTEKEEDKANLRKERDEIKKQIKELEKKKPAAPTRAMILKDRDKPYNPYVFLRGSAGQRGPNVPRRLPEVLAPLRNNEPFKEGSGRKELAEAIANRDNPLTARVMVNRLWQHHFGHGIVGTPSDFGYRGDAPTNPELLNFLAQKFMDGGWSVKKMHKVILSSHAYQQTSLPQPDSKQALEDPENRLVWRQNARRLDWEATRDSIMAVCGTLDDEVYGPSYKLKEEVTRRTVYVYLDRQDVPELLRNFDFTNPDASTDVRSQTTVPQQALFLMNSPFVNGQVKNVTERVMKEAGNREKGVPMLYRTILQRDPTKKESGLMLEYMSRSMQSDQLSVEVAFGNLVQVLLCSNEFLYVE